MVANPLEESTKWRNTRVDNLPNDGFNLAVLTFLKLGIR